jgi:transposase-like protein
VQLDGIWLTIVRKPETIKLDKRQRRRHQRTGKRVVVLVALGFWPDGRRQVLDWQIATSEEHTQWEKLLQRLEQRSLRPEQGLKAVVRDGSSGVARGFGAGLRHSTLTN